MNPRIFARRPDRTGLHSAARWTAALALIFLILVLPERLGAVGWGMLAQLPLELPLIVLGLIAFSGRAQSALRVLVVALLALMLLFKLANMGAYFGFARDFNPLVDTLMVPVVLDTLAKGRGFATAAGAVLAAVTVLGAVIAALVWATNVIIRGVPRHAQALVAGVAFALTMLAFLPGPNAFATLNAAMFLRDQAAAMSRNIKDAAAFRAQLLEDPFKDLPREHLLAGLKGHDVLVIFVESYGRSSLDHPDYSDTVRGALRRFGGMLETKGFAARSAWLDSPTFGGESYLAHSTVLSGLWVDNQQRYTQLLRSARGTLVSDFNAAGWRTVTVMPEITMPWPEVDYFKYGNVYTAANLGYKGAPFGYMTMSDQFAMAALERGELAASERRPVMATVGLVSSHIPWAPLPTLVPWDAVGDGTVFTEARTPESADEVWRDPKRIAQFYARSIAYSLETLMSFVETYGNDRTLLLIIGDHQPMTFIAGEGASHEVPVHLIAKDAAVIAALEQGSWTRGMEPEASSPVWPMDTLRGRILKAYTHQPQ